MISAAQAQGKRRNVIFILSDDHRYDAMGFLKGQPFLETPNMDRLASEGAHFKNAFVTTALCSPSRASILTGSYAHKHKVVDNNTAIPRGTVFFPSYLQKAGYQTAFLGKWHMGGEGDDPQPGFNHWISFRGQGTYNPSKDGLNINGKRAAQKGYITDELTDYALEWLNGLKKDQPYFMYLSHKAVHAEFEPAPRHKGRYANAKFNYPPTMAASGEMAQGRPMWVHNQRNSWHGVEFPYHSELDIEAYYKRYAETLLAVDESIGRVLDALRQRGQLDSTLVIYMGDNGFAFGEHGHIDKRSAYEESVRVPLIAHCPGLLPAGATVDELVANIDVAPTILEAAGLRPPRGLDGRSFLPLARGERTEWRKEILLEYFWEREYPQTPTYFALRDRRWKYVRPYGLWDVDELYDLESDPDESRNLIGSAEHTGVARDMGVRLSRLLRETDALLVPFTPFDGPQKHLRRAAGSRAAEFPRALIAPR